jgi:hypothetical protein
LRASLCQQHHSRDMCTVVSTTFSVIVQTSPLEADCGVNKRLMPYLSYLIVPNRFTVSSPSWHFLMHT